MVGFHNLPEISYRHFVFSHNVNAVIIWIYFKVVEFMYLYTVEIIKDSSK